MCSFGSSNSAPTTQYSTQSTIADPRAQQMYGQAWQTAQQTAQRPFQPYSSDPNAFVAPINQTQLSAIGNISNMQNSGQPYYQSGAPMMQQAGLSNAANMAPGYMSPYLDAVAASTMGILGQQQAMDRNRLSGDIAKNGQWGNSRSGVERALLAGQQNLATANTISGLYNTGYNTALGAAQTDLNRMLQAGTQLNAAGVTGQNALLGAGTLQQQTQQAGLQALYNQYLMQQQYPFQVAQFLSSSAAGLGPGYGGTTSGYQSSQQPLSYFGNPLSDPSLKVGAEGDEPEVIGQTNDGQDIYRYRVINPDTGEMGPVQIGLMADEVEHRRPDAIGDYNGFRTVDYAKATDNAARMGGGVMDRGDYADGGSIDDLLRSHEAMYSGLGKMPGGIVPQTQMATAKLDTPSLSFAKVDKVSGTSVGDLLSNTKGALELYKTGKGLYDDWKKTPGDSAAHASGGMVYDDTPELTHGPEVHEQPVAKLDTPELSFGSSGKNKEGTGIGDAIKGAASLAGTAKTLWDIGSTVGPALMALSDRRLKTGVRPGREGGGRLSASDLFDYLVKEKGADPREAAVLTSGAGVESSFNPGAVHDKGTGYGLWGHRLDRYDAMKKYTGQDRPDWRPQADFALDEFRHRPEHKMTMSSDSPEGLTRAQMFYERPAGFTTAHPEAGKYYDRRLALTRQLLGGDSGVMAMAGPESKPANAGIKAIEDATTPKGIAPANDDAAPQGISGFLRGTPASGLGEKALDFATSERFLLPLLTGLGTMASSGSRYLAPAVLQGLGAGAKAYMEVPKTQSEIMKNTLGIAAARFEPLENGKFYDTVLGREVSAQERTSAMNGMLGGTIGGASVTPYTAPAGPPSAGSPSAEPVVEQAKKTAKDVTAPVAAPAQSDTVGASGAASGILERASKDPVVSYYMDTAAAYEAEAKTLLAKPYVKGATERGNALRAQAAQYRALGMEARNKIAEPELAALRVEEEKKAGSKYEVEKVAGKPGEPSRLVKKSDILTGNIPDNAPIAENPSTFNEQQSRLGQFADSLPAAALQRQQTKQRLTSLVDLMKTYETGKFAEQKADFVASLRALNIPIKDTDGASPEKYQEFVKNASDLVMKQASTLSGPVLAKEIEQFNKANPSPSLQPGANRAIIGRSLGELAWQDKYYDDFNEWMGKNKYAYTSRDFDKEWIKNNPLSKFVKDATEQIPHDATEPVPPVEKRPVGYLKNKNGATWQWDGAKWVEVLQ